MRWFLNGSWMVGANEKPFVADLCRLASHTFVGSWGPACCVFLIFDWVQSWVSQFGGHFRAIRWKIHREPVWSIKQCDILIPLCIQRALSFNFEVLTFILWYTWLSRLFDFTILIRRYAAKPILTIVPLRRTSSNKYLLPSCFCPKNKEEVDESFPFAIA